MSQVDIKQSVEADSVGTKIRKLLRELYGQDVKAIMLWLPPGTTKMDFYSNCPPEGIILALRQVIEAFETRPVHELETRGPVEQTDTADVGLDDVDIFVTRVEQRRKELMISEDSLVSILAGALIGTCRAYKVDALEMVIESMEQHGE